MLQHHQADRTSGSRNNPDDLDVINELHVPREPFKYEGDVKVYPPPGDCSATRWAFEKVSAEGDKVLKGLKVASYYGCYLVRPTARSALDDVENPTVLDDLNGALGGDGDGLSLKTECCAAYQTVDNPGIVADRTNQIVTSARNRGAQRSWS